MSAGNIHPKTDPKLVREIFAAAASQTIATPAPTTGPIAVRAKWPDFERILNYSVEAASTFAEYQDIKDQEGKDAYHKALSEI
ncbi:hypothetical protein [Stenotrophomonas muris]|uniref:hypothetical protein n=1 Tax=Stenotrophomonas muris TaxID=2963283 RepID=UPI0032093BFE